MGDTLMTSRRKLLGTAASATGVALAATVWNNAAAAAGPGTFGAGHEFLELEGVTSGGLRSVDGGAVRADVVSEHGDPKTFARKHIGGPKYEEFTIQFGTGMTRAVYDWVADTWKMKSPRHSGAIVEADFDFKVRARREFTDALITEVGFPAADASSKDAGYLTVKFAPRVTRRSAGTGTVSGGGTQQKVWIPSNFVLEIDGLDCSRVAKVDAFTVKQTVTRDEIGQAREMLKTPGRIEFPNLRIALSQSTAQSWLDYFDDFVIKGNNGQEKEKNGSLTFLDPALSKVLFKVNFFNMGIFRLSEDKFEANADTIRRMIAEMYVERMDFTFDPGNGA